MGPDPYSIYFRPRPFRIAFLVNDDLEWAGRIIDFNRQKWGGAFNPIVPCNGADITEPWWSFLRSYDPDIIYTLVPLEDDLKKKIATFLSPLRVEGSRGDEKFIGLRDQPISIAVRPATIASFVKDVFGTKNQLGMFIVNANTPPLIKSFLERNFGLTYEEDQIHSLEDQKLLTDPNVKTYKISDDASLNEALLDLGEWRNRVIFSTHICAQPNSQEEADQSYNNDFFEVVVGDSFLDTVHFWNRTLMMGAWLRTRFTHLWLPLEMVNNSAIRPGLEKFINRYVGITGNDHSRQARFVSLSLTESDLKTIADGFIGRIQHPVRSVLLQTPDLPAYSRRGDRFFLPQGLPFHQAHSNQEYITVSEPDIQESFMGGEEWFMDLFIQYRPENFKHIIGKDSWWQLPRRNSLLKDLGMFDKPARINKRGMPSVLFQRRSSFHPDTLKLKITIPDDRAVFNALFRGESFDCFSTDEAVRYASRPFYHIQQSDKGMYLSGVLSLFSSLYQALHLFEERYWRTVFERMSNQNPAKDSGVKTELLNKLKKLVNSGVDFKNDKSQEWLAEKVVNLAKKYSKEEVDLTYADLKKMAEEETEEYNKKPDGTTIPFDEKDFKETLSNLVGRHVLLLGVRPKCPECGYKIWYQINDIGQEITCRGCDTDFSLQAEENWYYRLNSLVRAAVSLHGTVPLLLTLGQLSSFDSYSSFMYQPSTNLLRKNEDNKFFIHSEVDLVSLVDGNFVIGEVKQSVGLFSPSDFSKMTEIAKLVRPDKVIFSSMDQKPNTLVSEKIAEMKAELEPLEIKVEWFPMNYWVFTPRPVR